MFAYQTELNKGWLKSFLSCTVASVIDTVVTVAVYGLLAQLDEAGQSKVLFERGCFVRFVRHWFRVIRLSFLVMVIR
jgi:hypothetical protein